MAFGGCFQSRPFYDSLRTCMTLSYTPYFARGTEDIPVEAMMTFYPQNGARQRLIHVLRMGRALDWLGFRATLC